jgi:periplasmic divalent cation tolerance protein
LKDTYVVIMVAMASKKEAEKICTKLLEEKLIACANITGPVSSHFRWAEKIESVEEYLVFLKSRTAMFETICMRIKEMHSYKVPEIIALDIVKASKQYTDWIDSVLET